MKIIVKVMQELLTGITIIEESTEKDQVMWNKWKRKIGHDEQRI